MAREGPGEHCSLNGLGSERPMCWSIVGEWGSGWGLLKRLGDSGKNQIGWGEFEMF